MPVEIILIKAADKKPHVPQAGYVAVSNLIQHNGADFLPLNDAPTQVHFCTPLITMPYARYGVSYSVLSLPVRTLCSPRETIYLFRCCGFYRSQTVDSYDTVIISFRYFL